ncbi:MAG: terminase family protein [Treponema sp.]|jgi:phage FluMu gp28-like protein|nr:terminase family protein [Treponema sp.]
MKAAKNKTQTAEILLPYQKAWIEDESKLKIWEKSRRIGASWTEALNSVFHTQGAGSQSTYYLSYNKDMTRQFVADCKFWAGIINIAAGELQEEIIKENGKAFTVYRITFPNGKEIVGLPSVPYAIRSKQGRIIFDEAAFADEFEEVKKAALAMLIWGGSFSIISTHNGDDSEFYTFLKEIRDGKENDWSVHRTTFNEAIQQGLYKQICIKKKIKWTEKGETDFIKEIRGIYKSKAEEELDVIPSRSGSKYFPYGMLSACAADSSKLPIVRLDCPDSFMWELPEKCTKKIDDWFNVEVAPLLRQIKGTCFYGQDFARSGNLSLIWLGEERSKQELASRLIIELDNVPFDQQWQILWLINLHCKLGGAAIDARGNGQALAEAAARRLSCNSEMVMITSAWYAGIFQRLKNLLENRDFIVPDDLYILSDFGIVTLKNGKPAVPDTTRKDRDDKKAKRHGDGAVAAAMCLYA